MSVILILVLASLGVALIFLAAFVWAVKSGQYEDTSTPSLRVLADDPPRSVDASRTSQSNVRSP